jgi:prepilin-type N-terminal cleavage/methylation domain-containing protein
MLNKILLRKIKFPLSWRGAFSFCHSRDFLCHSRESGNPSSLSLRGAKQACPCESRGSNLNGFSLIELMVAVVILSMAIFGIFNAFNSGWMGMADARDRTVATNYVQEILEDIKNTPFEKIHSDTSQIGDTKFFRNISLSPNTNPNIKEVTAQVTWKNWKGSGKSVEASTLIYSQFSSEPTSEAVALVLYAEPYYNILPYSSSTVLTALVKDVNGNLVTDWDQPISFSLEYHDPSMGNLSKSSVTPVNGMATGVVFTSSGEFGEVIIIASSPGLTSDSVSLTITDAAVAIKLEADPATISTGEQSVINVSLLDASYVNPPVTISEHLVTLNVKNGPGTITGPITVLLNEANGGTSSTTLTSTGTPGIVTIIASSIDLESGVVNIPILGSAESISIKANPTSIYFNEDTAVTITIEDSAGNPVKYSGIINLSLSDPDNGNLTGGIYYNEGTGELTFSNESSKTITYAPSDAGEVNITALSVELSSQDIVTIYISKGLKIKLTAEPEIIIADGISSSTITATILDVNNEIVTDGTYQIVFTILSGEGYFEETSLQSTVDGVATIKLFSTGEPGSIITVSARSVGLTPDSVTVQTIYPKFISISADSNLLYINGKEDISITVVDSEGILAAYSGNINLTLSGSGSGSFNPESPLYYPVVKTTVFTPLSTGEVTITADGEGINSDFITIQILEKITFADNINILDSGKTITFDISVGGLALEIAQMNITWNSSSTLNKICFFSTTGPCFVYEPAVNSGDLINIEPITTLPSNVSTISLYFSGKMNRKTITVLFFDNNLIQYGPLEFTVP